MHVVVSEFMDESALVAFGATVDVTNDPNLVKDRARLLAVIADADALIVRNLTQVNEELLQAAPKLKVVGRLGVGLDNIDMEACKARGVKVCPALGANTVSVAEYVVGSAMSLVRGVYHSTEATIAGEWPRGQLGTGGEMLGKRLGLFGFGAIAQAVAARVRAFGVTVAAHDPFLPADNPAWESVENLSAAELISASDILSFHVPLTEQTKGMIAAKEISRMKRGAILINTSRGGVVDEEDVAAALKSGHLGGAALDVFTTEPLTPTARTLFFDVPNLILTPHISGVTSEGNERVSHLTVANVAEVLAKQGA